MSLEERVGWLLLGMAIGYIIRSMQEIKRDVREVDEIVKREKDEHGFMRNRYVADIAMILVILMCVWASFATQMTNNRLEAAIHDIEEADVEAAQTRDRLARITVCSQEYLSKTIKALNERTTYTQDQATANVELQLAQRDFLTLLASEPPITDEQAEDALRNYVNKLREFTDASEKSRKKTDRYAYPTSEELQACLAEG